MNVTYIVIDHVILRRYPFVSVVVLLCLRCAPVLSPPGLRWAGSSCVLSAIIVVHAFGAFVSCASSTKVRELELVADPGKKPTLVILPLRPQRIPSDLAQAINEIVAAEVHDHAVFQVITWSDVNSILEHEQTQELLGCDTVACAIEIGGALDARYLLTGSAVRLGDSVHFALQLIDVMKQSVVSRGKAETVAVEASYPRALARAVAEVLERPEPEPKVETHPQPVQPEPTPAEPDEKPAPVGDSYLGMGSLESIYHLFNFGFAWQVDRSTGGRVHLASIEFLEGALLQFGGTVAVGFTASLASIAFDFRSDGTGNDFYSALPAGVAFKLGRLLLSAKIHWLGEKATDEQPTSVTGDSGEQYSRRLVGGRIQAMWPLWTVYDSGREVTVKYGANLVPATLIAGCDVWAQAWSCWAGFGWPQFASIRKE